MNRYPWWKYAVMAVLVGLGVLFTVPTFFGMAPAIQVSAAKATVKVDEAVRDQVEKALNAQQVAHTGVHFEKNAQGLGTIKVRVRDGEAQNKARELISAALNANPAAAGYTVAFGSVSAAPDWMTAIGAKPIALGLDLRGGVHFLLEVKMDVAVSKRLEAANTAISNALKEAKMDVAKVDVAPEGLSVVLANPAQLNDAQAALNKANLTEGFDVSANGNAIGLRLTPAAIADIKNRAIKQNIEILHNRVNAMGASEPIVQQQGFDRIVVELPGESDPARAKSLIGRTATLEVRMEETTNPLNGQEFDMAGGAGKATLKKQVVIAGDAFTQARAEMGDGGAQVAVNLNAESGRAMLRNTAENVGKRMGIVMYEQQADGTSRGEVISLATIQGEFGDSFRITGSKSIQEADDLALLLRSGALAAPMTITQEATVGPSLGAENIQKGMNSLKYGFLGVALFMIAYYMLFGAISVIALMVNLLLLVGALAWLGVTMTLPGIAAVALTLGMAIDANVLINERVREELRNGQTPSMAIHLGFERAFATILDSNITTLIAGLALLIFGSGPIRGFAIVHCLGIATSMFSAVFVARGLVNLWYGRRQRLSAISIGQVWKKPAATTKGE